VFISGPSFAKEVMQGRPTGVVAASKDARLAREVQDLFASPNMRVNLTTDVIGEGWVAEGRRTGSTGGGSSGGIGIRSSRVSSLSSRRRIGRVSSSREEG
jgi:hypothetical protein